MVGHTQETGSTSMQRLVLAGGRWGGRRRAGVEAVGRTANSLGRLTICSAGRGSRNSDGRRHDGVRLAESGIEARCGTQIPRGREQCAARGTGVGGVKRNDKAEDVIVERSDVGRDGVNVNERVVGRRERKPS